MKKTLSISAVACMAALVASVSSCQNAGSAEESSKAVATESVAAGEYSFAYFDVAEVINRYDMANDLSSVVEAKANNIQAELSRKANKLQADYNELENKVNKGLITQSTAQVQAQKIAERQQEFQEYANKKQQEINEEQVVMMNQIGDAIKTYVDKYNETAGYQMIFANQGNSPIISAAASLDITEEIISGLNEEYIKNKNSKKEN